MGCGGSKPEEVATRTPPAADDQREAQRKFKEAQAKLEAEKKEKKRQSLEAAQLKELQLQQQAQEKAEEAGKEANEQAAAAIAHEMAADLAERQIEQARQADAAAKEEEQKNVVESFKGMGAKLRFRSALSRGMHDEARDAAGCMFQGAWRAKCARKAVAVKRAEKKRLMESGMARKIQSLYRCRKARRKAAAKREEKRQILADEAERKAAAAREASEKEAAEKEAAEKEAAEKEAAEKEAAEKEAAEKEALEKDTTEAVSVADLAIEFRPPEMKTGKIKKEGSLVKNWKTRHFVLRSMSPRSSRLTYFEAAKSTEPFGTDEKGSVEITKATKISDVNAKGLTLIFADGKNLNLEFLQDDDKAAWREAFQNHIDYCSK